jgi:hypothetical protein
MGRRGDSDTGGRKEGKKEMRRMKEEAEGKQEIKK